MQKPKRIQQQQNHAGKKKKQKTQKKYMSSGWKNDNKLKCTYEWNEEH